MKKAAFIVVIITILSKIFGFTKDIVLSYFYGANNLTDIYLIAITIPLSLLSFIGAGITTGYIPMYSKIEKKQGLEAANIYTNNLVNILVLICTGILIIGLLFTHQIVRVFASGFKEDTLSLAIAFTRICLVSVYFPIITYILKGLLQIRGKFAIPALIGVPMNLIIILSIPLSHYINIYILPIGTVVAVAAQVLFLLPFLFKENYRHGFTVNFKDQNIIDMAHLALPVILGVSIDQINILVDRTLASQICIGGISALTYANKLILFIQGVFVISISTVTYPMISKMAADKNILRLKELVCKSMNGINIIVIPITIGAVLFSKPIVMILFGRGAFDTQAVSMTSIALLFYSIGMIGYGLREVLSRAFYSLQDTKTPMYNAAIALIMNIVLNIILSRFMGIGGLALATSISALFCTCLLFINLRKKIGSFGLKNLSMSFTKILAASIIMGGCAKLIYNILIGKLGSNIALVFAIMVGAMAYFILVYLFRVDEVKDILTMIRRKIKGSKSYESKEVINA